MRKNLVVDGFRRAAKSGSPLAAAGVILTAALVLLPGFRVFASESGQGSELELKDLLKTAGYLCEQKCKEESREYGDKSDDYDEKRRELEEAIDTGRSKDEREKLKRQLVEGRLRLEDARFKYIGCLKDCLDEGADKAEEAPAGEEATQAATAKSTVFSTPVIAAGGAVAVAGIVAIGGGGSGGDGTEPGPPAPVDEVSTYSGSMSGSWGGSCPDGEKEGGHFTMNIAPDGSVTGSFSGTSSGSISGTVDNTGDFSAGSGTGSGGGTWRGQFTRSGDSLTASGTYSDTEGCSGTWSGSGNAVQNAARNGNTAAPQMVGTSTIAMNTLRVITDFMVNRAGHILNSQPDISGFLNSPARNPVSGQRGSSPANLHLNASPVGTRLDISSSLSRIRDARNEQLLFAALDKGEGVRTDALPSFAVPYGGGSPHAAGELLLSAAGDNPLVAYSQAGVEPGNVGNASSAEGTPSASEAMAERNFDIWTEINGAKSSAGDSDASLWVGYLGAHFFLSGDLIVGALGQLDWGKEENDSALTSAKGFGWMIGPYAAGRLPGRSLALELRAAWGQSGNSISPLGSYSDDFDTERWLVRSKLDGSYAMDALTFTPAASVSYYEETQEAYNDCLTNRIPKQTISMGEARFGSEVARAFEYSGSRVEPSFGISGVWNFNVNDANSSQGAPMGDEHLRARLDAGLTAASGQDWSLSVTGYYDGLGISDYEAYGGSVMLTVPLQ
jgi:hypothetical protein